MSGTQHLVVIGGGIAGLAAAWECSEDPGVRITVLEADQRFGGRIRTSTLDMGDGTTLDIDEGADAFLARVPDAVELCRELGLEDELTQPASGRAKVWVDGALRFLPTDAVLGVPLDVDELERCDILSPAGIDDVRGEAGRAGPPPSEDVSIGDFLASRFGPELVRRVVGPLIGGINAGDVDELSLTAVTPQLAEAAADGGVLSEALRRRRAAAAPDGPVFHGLLGGTGRLIDALVEQLERRGVALVAGARVEAVSRSDGPSSSVEVAGSEPLAADAVVLATPAAHAAKVLAHSSPDASRELGAVTYSSPVLVTLVFDRDAVGTTLDASGFLVPRDAGLLLTAASFGSAKWAHWDDGRHVIVRASAGHTHDDRPMSMTDDEIVAAITADLAETMGLTAEPVAARVSRYPRGFAQYTVGHLDRVDRIEAALARDLPTLRVAGSSYRGVGIPASIRSGRAAARALMPR